MTGPHHLAALLSSAYRKEQGHYIDATGLPLIIHSSTAMQSSPPRPEHYAGADTSASASSAPTAAAAPGPLTPASAPTRPTGTPLDGNAAGLVAARALPHTPPPSRQPSGLLVDTAARRSLGLSSGRSSSAPAHAASGSALPLALPTTPPRSPEPPPAEVSAAVLEAREGVAEADALLRMAHQQRRQLWELADRLMAVERGGRWEAERLQWEARHQVRSVVGEAQRVQQPAAHCWCRMDASLAN